MRKLLTILTLLSIALLACHAEADQSTPLFYTRTSIAIQRHALPAPLPWRPQNAPADNQPLLFDVEARDAMMLYNQKGWYNLSSPSDHSGVLLMFSAAGIAPIVPSKQYAPLDILLIDREGKITQIIPNIMLSQLTQEILPSSPVLAFLFLKGGTCQALSINPGDIVEHKWFVRPPLVLSSPGNAGEPPVDKRTADPARR